MKKKLFLTSSLVSALLTTICVCNSKFSTMVTNAISDDVIHTIIFDCEHNMLPREEGDFTFYNEVGTPIKGTVRFTGGVPSLQAEDYFDFKISSGLGNKIKYDVLLDIKGVSKIDCNVTYENGGSFLYYLFFEGEPFDFRSDNYINENSTGRLIALNFEVEGNAFVILSNFTIEYSETQCKLMS